MNGSENAKNLDHYLALNKKNKIKNRSRSQKM